MRPFTIADGLTRRLFVGLLVAAIRLMLLRPKVAAVVLLALTAAVLL